MFAPLVRDLKDLEESGITLDNGQIVQGAVIAFCGDNLGSHTIGGFTENFSRSKHFCRYCVIDRDTFTQSPTELGPSRTKQSHKDSVDLLAMNQGLADVDGVKFDSVFNSLKYFHVCDPGLPPCLGHDLFEGVVSTDLALYIKRLVTVGKHFTYTQLNRIISTFKYVQNDSTSRPCEVRADSEKLGGNASQNWCFLRLLPLLVGDRIKNPLEDEVWQLCLQLREIVAMITAPKIHANQVAYLKVLLEHYIHSRATLFPDKPLKPKHHYLLHYPGLILHFGPLIRLWTLRFESKHSFFKQCARKLHNFKNLNSTLAERHQLLQAYLQAGSLFPPTVQIQHADEFDGRLYNPDIQEAIRMRGLNEGSVVTPVITYKGTKYHKSMIVVVDHNDMGYTFGKIVLILLNSSQVYFVIEKHHSVPLMDLGVHCLLDSGVSYMCVRLESLADYYPLPLYKRFDVNLVSFHHAVYSK